MSNEVRTGLLALFAIALTLWGIKYIQGSNILSQADVFYANYDNVAGVQIGTPVRISGVTVGSVAERKIDFETQRVRLAFDMKQKVDLPKNTQAVLASIGVLG
ncbi:MAG: MlaD family protein, partial [Bacteroidota bacterium]